MRVILVDKKKEVAKEEEDTSLKPTRPISSYIFFSNVTVPKVKKDEGVAHKDAMARAG